MKNTVCLIIAAFSVSLVVQAELEQHDWIAALKIVDDNGQPVKNAEVQASYGSTNTIAGLSDAAGMFIASHRDAVENLVFSA